MAAAGWCLDALVIRAVPEQLRPAEAAMEETLMGALAASGAAPPS